MNVAKILKHVFHHEVRAVDPTVVRVEGNRLKCFHVAFILFGRCNSETVNRYRCYEDGIEIWERSKKNAHC